MKRTLACACWVLAAAVAARGQTASAPAVSPEAQAARAAALARDIMAADLDLRLKTRMDLLLGGYRDLTVDQLFAAVMPAIEMRDPDCRKDRQYDLISQVPTLLKGRERDALPVLLKILADDDREGIVRSCAIMAAARIAPDDARVLAEAVRFLKMPRASGDTADWRTGALIALGEMGAHAAGAKDEIARLTSGQEEPLERGAFSALGAITHAQFPQRDFSASLKDRRSPIEERAAAVAALNEQAGKRINTSPPAEFDHAAFAAAAMDKERSPVERNAVLGAMAYAGIGADVPLMRQLLALCDDPAVAGQAINALSTGDFSDPACAPIVVSAFHKDVARTQINWVVPWKLAKAMPKFGPAARDAAPDLFAAIAALPPISHQNAWGDELTAYLAALVSFGPQTPGLQKLVVELLSPQHPLASAAEEPAFVFDAALRSLDKMGLPSDKALRDTAMARVMAVYSQQPESMMWYMEKLPAEELQAHAGEIMPVLLKLVSADLPVILPVGADATARAYETRDLDAALSAVRLLEKMGDPALPAAEPLKAIAAREVPPPSYPTPRMMRTAELIAESKKALAAKPFAAK